MLSIDAKSSREIQAVILALKQTDKTLTKLIRKQSQTVIVPEWKKALDSRAVTPLEKKVLAGTGKVAVSDSNVTLRVALGSKKLPGGLSYDDARGLEFGANRFLVVAYRQRSRKGKSFAIKRHTQKQFVNYKKAGLVVYPSAENMIPRVAALWVQTVVKAYRTAFEGSVLDG